MPIILTEHKIAEIEHDVAEALSEIINLCNPPPEKAEKIQDLVCSIQGEINDLRGES